MFEKKTVIEALQKIQEGISFFVVALETEMPDAPQSAKSENAAPAKTVATDKSKKAAKPEKKAKAVPDMQEINSLNDDSGDEDEESDEDDLGDVEDEAQEPEALTSDAVREKLVAFATKNGKEKAWKIMDKYGSRKVSDIDPKHYAKIMAALS